MRLTTLPAAGALLLHISLFAQTADAPQKDFALPAEEAAQSLKAFSAQSSVEVLIEAELSHRVVTNAVRGEMTPREALDRMLAGTGLVAVADPESGALMIKRSETVPNAPRAAPVEMTSDRPKDKGEMITLNPFEVKADSDKSYGALNSRSITAFNTALDKMPVSADIFDQAFMRDVGATSVEDMIQAYSAGSGFGGLNAGAVAFQGQPGDRVTQAYIQLRGMPTPNIQRDGLLFLGWPGAPGGTSIGQSSNFDADRVEIVNGPNALLYDGGGGGGVINVVSKQAHIGMPASGSLTYRNDQWGTKYGLLDYGASRGPVAVRLALIDASDQSRRTDIGDHLTGAYLQFAAKLGNTTVRLSLEQTTDFRRIASYTTLSSSGDPVYSGLNSRSLANALLTEPHPGEIDNGSLTWSNAQSYAGSLSSADSVAEFATIEADTQWTDWLSTQLSAGISDFDEDHSMDVQGMVLYSPQATANPLKGNWTMAMTNAYSAQDADRPARGQALRLSALLTNDLFNGRASSQTVVGGDLVDSRTALVNYAYYAADANWDVYNTATDPIPVGSNLAVSDPLGRSRLPKLTWTVNKGPLAYPLFRLGSPRITWNGVHYVRMMENPFVKADVSPSNPLGTTLTGINGLHGADLNDGAYVTNYTHWAGGKLDTLFGARLEHAYEYSAGPAKAAGSLGFPTQLVDSHSLNFDVGADYHVLSWLTPYFSVSDSYLAPPSMTNDLDGNPLPVGQSLGAETGIKIANPAGTLSGSLSAYHSLAKNEEFIMTSTLQNDVNPAGLNGSFGGNGYAAGVVSDGLQLILTASPTPNWRLRLSAAAVDGRVRTTRSYGVLYNDQFYENGQGQVTFADGAPVYVNPTAYHLPYAREGAPGGSQPLTVAMLSTPGNPYFANPLVNSGAISSSSNGAKVLQYVDPPASAGGYGHGAILTGAVGLPISQYQLNPALSGVAPVASPITVAQSGDVSTGYPEFSANLTSVHEFPSGWLKGFEAGGTATASWRQRSYYYYPTSLTAGGPLAPRALFTLPTSVRLNLILGYTVKLLHVSLSTQLNVYNLFNHYGVIVYPNVVSGWASPGAVNPNFYQQPRSYVWTTTLQF